MVKAFCIPSFQNSVFCEEFQKFSHLNIYFLDQYDDDDDDDDDVWTSTFDISQATKVLYMGGSPMQLIMTQNPSTTDQSVLLKCCILEPHRNSNLT